MGSRRLCYGENLDALWTATGLLEVAKLRPPCFQSALLFLPLELEVDLLCGHIHYQAWWLLGLPLQGQLSHQQAAADKSKSVPVQF